MQGKRKRENPRDEEREEVLGFSPRGREGGLEGGRNGNGQRDAGGFHWVDG